MMRVYTHTPIHTCIRMCACGFNYNSYVIHGHTCSRVINYTEKCGLPTRVRKVESLSRVDADRRETLRRENEQIWARHMSEYAMTVQEVRLCASCDILSIACRRVCVCVFVCMRTSPVQCFFGRNKMVKWWFYENGRIPIV